MKELIFFGFIVLVLVMGGCSKEMPTGRAILDVEKTSTVSCTDSDSGKNAEVKGIVTFIDENRNDNTYADSCVSGLLIEYYCEENKASNQNLRCPSKCLNGACVQE